MARQYKPKSKPVFCKCGHCNGTGRVELTGVYLETLRGLRRIPYPIHAGAHAYLFGCKPTALNNRLAQLERMGFAESRREGRKRLYWAKK